MQFSIIVNQILVLFIIILIGYLISKKGIITEEVSRGLASLLTNVTLPALIISSMPTKLTSRMLINIKTIGLLWLLIEMLVIIFVMSISNFFSFYQGQKSVFNFLLIFSNVGYMGFPVVDAIYPESGLLYATIVLIIYNSLLWTYGTYIFIKEKNNENRIQLKRLFNNGFFAVIIGFIILFTGYQLPKPITGALNSLGGMTFPLAMLVIGGFLTNVKFKEVVRNKRLYILGSLRLVIIPLIVFIVLKQFDLSLVIRNIIIIFFAAPSATITPIFAKKFKADYKFASEGVCFTTLLSLITIPLFIYLINL